MSDKPTGLELMRKPFSDSQISILCKTTNKDNQKGRCKDCGGWHKVPSVPISYVGHAALTDRLLDADINWSWEPLSYAPDGSPFLDANGGMWIKLTVCGVTRLGYGDAGEKKGGDAMKERIGDALRNAAMRFGAALDLWHKGDLHADEEEPAQKFEKQADGTFAKSVPNQGTTVPKVSTETAQELGKKVVKEMAENLKASKTKKPAAPKPNKATDFPHGHNAPSLPQEPVTGTGNIHGVNDLTDADVPFPGDQEKDREATPEEHADFRKRMIAIKDKGHSGLGQWLIKISGYPRTNDIPYGKFKAYVEQVEAAEKAGTLKELIA